MYRHMLAALVALTGYVVVSQASACSIEHATYAYSADKNITLDFQNFGHLEGWLSPLALGVHLGKSRPSYWFLFDQGSARYTYLISTTDVRAPGWKPPDPDGGVRPLGFMEYFSWDADLHVREIVPKPRDKAAAFIFLPDLPDKLFMQGTPRTSIAAGLFTYKSCAR